MNKVVARYVDGRVLKGTTVDFSASREFFHLVDPDSVDGWDRTKILVEELKALFYVKDFAGDPSHVDQPVLRDPLPPGERGVKVVFYDGEVLVGTTHHHRISGPGFFVVPADPGSNNERCFVVEAATQDVLPL